MFRQHNARRCAAITMIFLFLGSFFALPSLVASSNGQPLISGSQAINTLQGVNQISRARPLTQPSPITFSFPQSGASTDPSSSWVPLGPQPIATNSTFTWGEPPFSGRITAIVVNGSNTQDIYVGAAQGGVWKTTDGAATWSPLTDAQPNLAVGSMALAPNNKTIYVGTGEGNECVDCYYGIGLLKSIDGGATWAILGQSTFTGMAITSILINPFRPNQIFVSTTRDPCCKGQSLSTNSTDPGSFLSTDGGITWTEVLPESQWGVAQLTLVPQSTPSGYGYVPFAGDFGGDGWIYQTSNFTSNEPEMDWRGGTWMQVLSESKEMPPIDTNCASSVLCRLAVASSAAQPNFVYVAFVNSSGALTTLGDCDIVHRTCTAFSNPQNVMDNFGDIVPPCGANRQGWYDLVLTVDPTNANSIYFGCTTLYHSTNGGTTWTPLGGYEAGSIIHPDMHALVFMPGNPDAIFVGNDGGIWESTNQGAIWTNLNENLALTQFYYVAVSNSGGSILAGAQDNGCDEYSGSLSWNQVTTGDGGWVGFDPANNQILYCVQGGYPLISMNGGQTFQVATSGISQGGSLDAPMAQDPNNPGTLYFGAQNIIYKTTTDMGSWVLAYQGSSADIVSIAVASSNSSIVYAGDSSGNVLISTNAGSTWSILRTLSNPIASIAVNPINANDVYVTTSSFESPAIVEFLNGAQKAVSTTGLPSSSINVIKTFQGKIFAGLDSGGVYYLELGESSWAQVGSALPNSAVFDLAASNGTLYAATHGRGVWAINTPLLEEIRLTLSYQVIGGRTGYSSPTLDFVSQGASRTVTLNTTSGTVYADYGTGWSVNAELVGSNSSERWETNLVSGSATSNQTLVISYYQQFLQTLYFSVVSGGSPIPPTATGEQFGSTYYQALTTSPTGYWFDAGSLITFMNPITGAAGERWISATLGITASSSQTVGLTYYHQYYFSLGSDASSGGSVTGTSGWYNSSSSVSISASAASGWQFEGWSGTGASSYSGSSGATLLTLNGPVNETAVFYAGLTLNAGADGSISYSYGSTSGTVPAGTSKTIYLPPGTNVVVSETPSSFLYAFSSWTGSLTGTAASRSLSINSPSQIGANFALNILILVVIVVVVIAAVGGIVAVIKRKK